MRNPFKRQPRANGKPTLRERLAATREDLGTALRIHRALKASPSKPAPQVDRAALINYATWLYVERRLVCAELYPHLGARSTSFVLEVSGANHFHFPPGKRWQDVPPPSARAVQVLDLIGVDWRKDVPGERLESAISSGLVDTAERPALPFGWPAIDAALVTAAGDLLRLDAAIEALLPSDERSIEGAPGYAGLDEARTAALVTLSDTRAESLRGLQAKARAILSPGLVGDPHTAEDLAQSLSRDLLRAAGGTIEPQPDPVFAAIKECERLEALAAAEEDRNASGDSTPAQTAAVVAVWDHINGPLSETVPTTAAGCVALARFIPKLFDRWAASLDGEQAGKLFRLIERSPAL